MENPKTVWGGIAGKIIATLLVLAVICTAAVISLTYARKGESLLSKDEIYILSSVDNKDGTVSVKLRLEKDGYYLSSYKTEREDAKLLLRLYASITERDIKPDDTGVYTLEIKVDEDIADVVQEGPDDERYTLVKINIEG